jgi:septum formation protein
MRKIILASASLWRRRLLKKHGIPCKVHISNFKEIKRHEKPELLVVHNACGKAEAVARHYKNAIVIGVDTIGVLKGKVIGKPKDREHAKRMIKTLAGTTHRVISGLCIIDTLSGKKIKTKAVTKVTFRKVSEAELEKYLDSNHWKGKAGAYAIQGRAKGFVAKIEGDFTNVVGIPVEILKKMLKRISGS